MALHVINEQRNPETQTWSLWYPAKPELVKSFTNDDGEYWISGLISDEKKDLDEEVVLGDGIIFEPLVRSGFINYDHQKGPEWLIGVPTEADFRDTKNGFGLWTKGYLYKGKTQAENAWEHLLIASEAEKRGLPPRSLGWSVEGGIVQRDPYNKKIIKKSIVRHVALTPQPVNDRTYAEIAKSLGSSWQGPIDFDTNEHLSFTDFGSFAKSMSGRDVSNTFDGSPLQLESFGGQVTEVLPEFFGKKCKGHCKKEITGRRKALKHLNKCLGIDVDEAYEMVKSLVEYLD